VQIPVPEPVESVTTQTQDDTIIEHFELRDAKHPTGIAFAMVQLWYYHYPVKEVCTLYNCEILSKTHVGCGTMFETQDEIVM
jgi:hypothetical protein